MPASGNAPTASPSRSRLRARRYAAAGAWRSTGMCRIRSIAQPTGGDAPGVVAAHEPHEAVPLDRGLLDQHEVGVRHVVDRQQHGPAGREVLLPLDPDPYVERAEQAATDGVDRSIDPVAHDRASLGGRTLVSPVDRGNPRLSGVATPDNQGFSPSTPGPGQPQTTKGPCRIGRGPSLVSGQISSGTTRSRSRPEPRPGLRRCRSRSRSCRNRSRSTPRRGPPRWAPPGCCGNAPGRCPPGSACR